MTLGEEIRGHLPYLRRYARALTGSQQHGDNFVHTTLVVIVAAAGEFHSGAGTRIDLYRSFHRIWESAYIDDGEGRDDAANTLVRAEQDRKRVVKGKSVSVRVDIDGSRIIKEKTYIELQEKSEI